MKILVYNSPMSHLPPALRIAVLILFAAGVRAAPAKPYDSAAIVPETTIVLFNGKDLSAFYTWLPRSGYSDPDHVFTVVDQVDGAPAIRISGQHHGGLITKANYANYRLVAEYRYGSVTWGSRANKARDSGILIHGQGHDGAYQADFRSPWLRSIEYQIIEGGTGDLLVLSGVVPGERDRVATRLTLCVAPGKRVWDPSGTPTEFTSGRIDWPGRDPKWTDTLGFRGPRDVEHPVGEWNRIEAICAGGDLTYFLNGTKVNEARNGTLREGRLLVQSEGAEIFFRRLELHPLAK